MAGDCVHAWSGFLQAESGQFQQSVYKAVGKGLRGGRAGISSEYGGAVPAQMQDCKTAIRYVRRNAERLGFDPGRIALFGDSAGGHTVLVAGFTGDAAPDTPEYAETSAEVSCIVDWYGPTDFVKMNYYPSSQDHNPADCPEGMELGGVSVLENPDRSREASPMTYLSEDRPTPPTLIMHGGRDLLVPFNQSCRLYVTMRALGKDVTFLSLIHI